MLKTNRNIEKLMKRTTVSRKIKDKLIKQVTALKVRISKLEEIISKPTKEEV